MDMSGMSGMSGMGGMDMSSEGPFLATNQRLARAYWYGIVGVVGLLTCVRLAGIWQSWRRRRQHRRFPDRVASRPRGALSQACATVTAAFREMAYPQPVHFTGRFAKYFTPLPLGRWLLLAFYWVVLLCFLWTNTILTPSSPMYGYKWEKVGFRAAWVTVTQIPFVYLLSCKFNPISLLTGISYERFNWLHRWAARTVFLTAIVHWSFFFREWWLADFVAFEFTLMPMVKYGFGAWATVGWMILSGFGFARNLSYEVFVAQHIAAAATLLWLLYVHVPDYARYNIYMSIGFLAFDWGCRLVWAVVRNLHVFGRFKLRRPGYAARLEALSGDVVRVVIDDADFNWKAGQHAYVSIPRLRPLELHPFTIANVAGEATPGQGQSKRLSFVVQARRGFSKSLRKAAVKGGALDRQYRTFVTGPWGTPPDLSHYDSVVFIACSTGASFTTPLLQDLIRRRGGCARSITFHWVIRHEEHFEWFAEELEAVVLQAAKQADARLQIVVHVTRTPTQLGVSLRGSPSMQSSDIDLSAVDKAMYSVETESVQASSAGSVSSLEYEKAPLSRAAVAHSSGRLPCLSMSHGFRPTVESMIRPPVEAAFGETAVVVCGGVSVTAQSRTFVAALSDERAVHKGSGAQGIRLFTETYGW